MNKTADNSYSLLCDNRGIALPLVLMVMLVLTVFGVAAYTASQSSLKQTTLLRPNLQAKYLARSAVDATIAAWTDEWTTSPGTAPAGAQFYTRYDTATDEFVEAEATDVGQDMVIATNLSYDAEDGICTITASATADGKTATVSAVSEGLVTAESSDLPYPLYEYHLYRFLFWTWYDYIFIPNPDSTEYLSGDTFKGSYYYVDGILNVSVPDNKTLYLDADETDYDAIGLQAKRIIFNSPLDLYTKNTLIAQILVVSAETIDFNNDITIGDSRHGNLSLHLPDGFGISGEKVYHRVSDAEKDKVVLTARYGLVSFSNIKIMGSFINNNNSTTYINNNIAGKTFFFRMPDDEDYYSLNIGTEERAFSGLDPNEVPSEKDFTFKSLRDKGYLIPVASGDISDYDVLFVYQ